MFVNLADMYNRVVPLRKKYEIGVHSLFIYNRFRLLYEYFGEMLSAMIIM